MISARKLQLSIGFRTLSIFIGTLESHDNLAREAAAFSVEPVYKAFGKVILTLRYNLDSVQSQIA